ncbi:methionine synthase [Mesoterricola sediminis]|uniref:Methionine synthase n=1 Tax=Mesoterricola sediminis TaxID=2927980 RepID=A0AA48H0I8_9BACT|nr:methionine synthase [Mesoterricola sediminis]BDU75256.1 5-methyltetrahydrofolate--homocysteine methyltransferase [Mesoterricola sediminis]
MTALSSFLLDQVLLLDGGMGTQIMARRPTVDDFGGSALDGCMEVLNARRPDWIRAIHADYLDAGADAVETNTFGANEVVLGEFGIADRTEELNATAARLALEVARDYDRRRYVIGSVGPGTKLLTLGHVGYDALFRSYLAQMRGLLRGGVDAVLIETSQDLGQMKVAVRAARAAMAELRLTRPLWVQATVETTGTLLLGTEIQAVITTLEMLGIDVLGLNCGTGPDEMHAPLQALAEASPCRISCLPNAGLPVNRDGALVYPLEPEAFAAKVARLAGTFGLGIVGGCCGTTPAHIRALRAALGTAPATRRVPAVDRSVSSLYQSVALRQEPRPLIVGERTNANGSKKFRDLLAAEDVDGLVEIAQDQQREGAHMLDVCVAYVGRDEAADMEAFLGKAVTQVTLPLMIDSTEVPVIERALRAAPGKCVVNSINFEDGDARARKVLDLCREYGAAVVGLTIDERGMARTAGDKAAIAARLVDLVVGEYGFNPSDLIIDPLTFTLGSGEEGMRRSALETLEAIRRIKAAHHGVLTLLGVSNVSFGLAPAARHVLNALMLYHAVKAGLDLAIFNSAKVIPVAAIPADQRAAAEDLLFDRRREDYDPLKTLMALFSGGAARPEAAVPEEGLPVAERLRRDIIGGAKRQILADVDEALAILPPLEIINDILLDGMRVVGERFGAGEMQLPFVLESAEAMKAAVKRIEPWIPRESSAAKGRIILATVKGDVHDIGKNLVEIILSNNGYEVVNLGIKQPIEAILQALETHGADAIGLSGLLVKSTTIMREDLVTMAERGLDIPVLLGGAALTRDYVAQQCQSVYPGPVLYAEDAFEGLRHMDRLTAKRAGGGAQPAPAPPAPEAPAITVLRRGGAAVPLTPDGQSAWVTRDLPSPEPPFWGVREAETPLATIFDFLDTFTVIRNRWSFTQGQLSDAAFEAVLQEKAEPLLAAWKARILGEGLLAPRARYGYFPVQADGDALRVFDPGRGRVLATLRLPRQATGRRLCIADFFHPAASGRFDVLPVQLVTLGQGAADLARRLYAEDKYQDYFLFHGLATELTEAFAEGLHARIRRELGIHGRDAAQLRQLFSQGYQGSRYSFGYPACPDLAGNGELLDLLDGGAIGVTLTEQCQMDPEYATSALVAWHPQARYFAV